MKSSKGIFTIIGLIMIIAQVVSFYGMSSMDVGLYPNEDDLPYYSYGIEESGLTIRELMFAAEAGYDRFLSGFEDLEYSEYEYRHMTVNQMTSAMIRESLGCSSGGSVGLYIYDLVLTLSYCGAGIFGIFLLIVAYKAKDNKSIVAEEDFDEEDFDEEYYDEDFYEE